MAVADGDRRPRWRSHRWGGRRRFAWLARRFAPETAGSGIPRVEAVLRTHVRPAGAHILPVKFIGGVLSIGSGLALAVRGPRFKWVEPSADSSVMG